MTTRETLIASLAIDAASDNVTLQDGYADWSVINDDGTLSLEIGNQDGEAVQLTIDRADMLALHRALTLTLLQGW